MASEELKQKAIEEVGLSKQQTESATFKKTIDWLLSQSGENDLKKEIERQVCEAREQVLKMGRLYDDTLKKVQPLLDVHENSEGLSDERAKNAIALYAGLLNIIDKRFHNKVDADKTVNSLSYILWAYLGGQLTPEMLEEQTKQFSEPKYTPKKAGRQI